MSNAAQQLFGEEECATKTGREIPVAVLERL